MAQNLTNWRRFIVINFEGFLDFEDFLANPTAALKAAQRKVEEAVEEEERQLKAKAAQQKKESEVSYQRAVMALRQQYEELREAKGLNEMEQTISEQAARLNNVSDQIKNLKMEVEKEKSKHEETIERVKVKAKAKVVKSGTSAYNAMKRFYDSNVDAAIKDKVRYMPSDEALEYIAQLDAGLTPEEIEERGYTEIKPKPQPQPQIIEWHTL